MDKEEKRRVLILILLLLIIVIIIIMSNILGKVSYVNSDVTEQLDLIEVTQNDIGWDMLEELNIFINRLSKILPKEKQIEALHNERLVALYPTKEQEVLLA